MLDTNAWLDLLVFTDPSLAGFADAARDGSVRIVTDHRAIAELERVLRYGVLRLDEAAARSHLDVTRRLATCIDVPAMTLPRCRDPDDQMFLEIAVAARADALLTRDAELLRMARRMAREHGVAVVAPSMWRDVSAQMSKR
ncbi:putative toxin-antitoxin system toxin component, PIN family [Lysobacter sp. TY2-98]|uniref:putative toxin-antitoxin system toxin component, PIN family n=1 Tax=Lysobacter sp. TY2-98 TaxID=2290922 RepID=UPI0013B434CD|nr:putative toxin-antitoxin system toxin component, PIN family [Lysobacter sp. TY2-98]